MTFKTTGHIEWEDEYGDYEIRERKATTIYTLPVDDRPEASRIRRENVNDQIRKSEGRKERLAAIKRDFQAALDEPDGTDKPSRPVTRHQNLLADPLFGEAYKAGYEGRDLPVPPNDTEGFRTIWDGYYKDGLDRKANDEARKAYEEALNAEAEGDASVSTLDAIEAFAPRYDIGTEGVTRKSEPEGDPTGGLDLTGWDDAARADIEAGKKPACPGCGGRFYIYLRSIDTHSCGNGDCSRFMVAVNLPRRMTKTEPVKRVVNDTSGLVGTPDNPAVPFDAVIFRAGDRNWLFFFNGTSKGSWSSSGWARRAAIKAGSVNPVIVKSDTEAKLRMTELRERTGS